MNTPIIDSVPVRSELRPQPDGGRPRAREVRRRAYASRARAPQPSRVNPLAIEALREAGVDISAHVSKSVDTIDPAHGGSRHHVVRRRGLPAGLAGVPRVHWPLPDPAGPDRSIERFREARDEIARRLDALGAELGLVE